MTAEPLVTYSESSMSRLTVSYNLPKNHLDQKKTTACHWER